MSPSDLNGVPVAADLAIDEPVTHDSARIRLLPTVSAGQHTDSIEATRHNLWRCEAWLLADCWQLVRVVAVAEVAAGHVHDLVGVSGEHQPVSRRVYRQLSQLARPMTSHMKPTPRTVQAKVRRLGWRAWASGRMSEVAR